MKVLFDTDVTLDLLIDRKPYSDTIAILFTKVEKGEFEGYLCATTITTIHYLASKTLGSKKARSSIRKLLSFMKVAGVDQKVILSALDGKGQDFEDEVISQAALRMGVKAIVTRNIKDFKKSEVTAYDPNEFMQVISVQD